MSTLDAVLQEIRSEEENHRIGQKRKTTTPQKELMSYTKSKFQKKIPSFKPLISPTKKILPVVQNSDEDFIDIGEIPSQTQIYFDSLRQRLIDEFKVQVEVAKIHVGKKKMKLEKAHVNKIPPFVIVGPQGLEKYDSILHCIPPVVLKSQLYASIGSATLVERELEEMNQKNSVKIFRFLSDREDYGIVSTSDYIKQIELKKERWIQNNKENEKSVEESKIIDLFLSNLVPSWKSYSITRKQLKEQLKKGEELNEKEIVALMDCGVILTKDHDTFWLSIPNIGPFIKHLMQGRKELVRMIGRKKWKEILMSDLEKKNVKYSILGPELHVEDLIGREAAESVDTPVGKLIRLKENK